MPTARFETSRSEVAIEPADQSGVRGIPIGAADRGGGSLRITLVSLVSILGATLLALSAVPDEPTKAGALFIPGTILSIGLMAGVLVDIAARGPRQALRAEHILPFGVVYFLLLDLIQGRYDVDSPSAAIRSSLSATGLFGAALVFGAALHPPRLPGVLRNLAARPYNRRTFSVAIVVCFVLGMFDFAFWSSFSPETMWQGLQASRFLAPWNRGAEGSWNAFLDFMINFGFLVPTLTAMLAVERGRSWLHWSVVGGAILSGIFLAFVAQGGGRRVVASILLAPLIAGLSYNRQRIRMKHLVLASGVLLGTLVVSDAILENRNRGLGSFSYDVGSFTAIRVDDNFRRMAQVFDAIPDYHPHVGFDWVVWVLARPVPRVLWPDKPLGPGFSVAGFENVKDTSLSTGVIGEWYMAFGWTGVVVGGLLTGYLCRFWSQLVEQEFPSTGSALYALGAMALFIGLRSGIELVLFTYPIVCWIVVDRLFLQRRKRSYPGLRIPLPLGDLRP